MDRIKIGSAAVGTGGVASTTYAIPSNAEVGTHKIEAIYLENDTYRRSVSDAKDYIISKKTITTVENALGSKDETITLKATVKYDGTNPVTGGQVQFKVGGAIVGTGTVSAGIATLEYTVTVDEDATLEAIYLGVTGLYGVSNSEIGKLSVRKGTNLLVQAITGNRGEEITISGTVTAADGTNVTTGDVEIYLDGNKIKTVTVTDGVLSTTYTILDDAVPGTHTLKFKYLQNNTYDAGEITAQLTIRSPTTITVNNLSANPSEKITLQANLKDLSNISVTEGVVTFYIGSTELTANVSAGGVATAEYTVPADATGTISFNAKYTQSANYEGATSENGIITIRKVVQITVEPVTANIGETPTLVASVNDTDGQAVTTGTVDFEIYDV